MIILYSLISLAILWFVGYCFFDGFRISTPRSSSLFVLVGFCCLLSVSMTIGAVVPLSCVAPMIIIGLCLYFLRRSKELSQYLLSVLTCKNSIVFIGTLIPILVFSWPHLLKNELFTIIVDNNDFAYYIASIDWLKTHSIYEPVGYSLSKPFYSLAEYMIDYTRIGLDVAGAIFANIYLLESYQVFPLMVVLASVFVYLSIYNILLNQGINKNCCIFVALCASVNGNIISLLSKQYPSQVIGVALLVMSFYYLAVVFKKGDKDSILLTSILVSGLLATYCEFTLYVVLFALINIMVLIWRKNIKLTQLLQLAVLSVLFNVIGFFRAIDFNYKIFNRVATNGAADIDPYMGNMLGFPRVIACMVGYSPSDFKSSHIILGVAVFSALLLVGVYLLIKQRFSKNLLLIGIGTIFCSLETYFVLVGGAYQEFKHVTSFGVIAFIFWGLLLNTVSRFEVKKRFIWSGITIFVTGVVILAYRPMNMYLNPTFAITKDSLELQQAVKHFVGDDEFIEVDSSLGVANLMIASYALRHHIVNLNTNYSYLQFFQKFEDDDNSRFLLKPKTNQLTLPENEVIRWTNKDFSLVERLNIPKKYSLDLINGGFHSRKGVTVSPTGGYRVNDDGLSGYVLYGPYIQVNGQYDITLKYTVLRSASNVGVFDINSNTTILYSQELKKELGQHLLILKNQQFDNTKNIEFRVFANEGAVVRIDSIEYARSEDE